MLFLRTGSLMGQIGGTQDSRFYGGFYSSYSSFLFFVVSCLCLSGFPFFLGFYSKDFIIVSGNLNEGLFLYFLFLLACFFTVVYRIRLIHQCYVKILKNVVFIIFSERLNFFLPVSFLFLKCWVLGGVFYWLFLSGMNMFLSFFDIFFGLLLFFSGFFMYFFIRLFFSFFFRLGIILFLRWKASGGRSFFFHRFFYNSFEKTWMEMLGGRGSFFLVSRLNNFAIHIHFIRLGVLIFISFTFCVYFFFFIK